MTDLARQLGGGSFFDLIAASGTDEEINQSVDFEEEVILELDREEYARMRRASEDWERSELGKVDGRLSPSIGTPFTHILKPAGTSGFEALTLVEWIGLALARGAGFTVPDAALSAMPDDMPPALLVERFDIREGADDHRLLAMEDHCTVLDLSPEAKYDGTIERVARALRGISTSPDEDLLILMKRVVFAWPIADGDMHLKNMAVLKIAEPGDPAFRSVRLAPAYDTLTTRDFPRLEHGRMALKLNGKDERLRRADFLAVSAIAGLRASDTHAAIDDVLERMRAAVAAITLPTFPGYGPWGEAAVTRTLEGKTFKGDLDLMPANHRHLHWAQAKVYGAMACRQFGLPALTVSLVYFDIDKQAEAPPLHQHCAAPDLLAFFEALCEHFLLWAELELVHRSQRDAALIRLRFPHAEFRAGQRDLAKAVFNAARLGRSLLAQAPTGIGKTVARLFPMLKACPGQELDKVFFLTAKSSPRPTHLRRHPKTGSSRFGRCLPPLFCRTRGAVGQGKGRLKNLSSNSAAVAGTARKTWTVTISVQASTS